MTFWSNFFFKKVLALLFCIVITFSFAGCVNSDDPIKCASGYIISKVEIEKVDSFTNLEGIDVWENWEYLTSSIAEDHQQVDSCGIYNYLSYYNETIDSLHGRMFFVYSVHSYLKYGFVDEEKVAIKVDSLCH